MNIEDLAKQAGFDFDDYYDSLTQEQLVLFADFVRQDEANGMRETYIKMVQGAIAEEREACALLCEEWYLSGDVAKAIRARGNE